MPERIISEFEKAALGRINFEHGQLLSTDLRVLHDYGSGIGVVDERAAISREGKIGGISVEADGNYMWYTVAYDENGNVIDVIRRWQNKTRVFATSLASCIDAHYHPAPGKHGWNGTYPGLGRHVLTLGDDLDTFDAAFEAMWFELAICKGKILPFEQRPVLQKWQRPQTDLTLQALKSFANGFRQAAISFNLEGISLQAEELLGEFPT